MGILDQLEIILTFLGNDLAHIGHCAAEAGVRDEVLLLGPGILVFGCWWCELFSPIWVVAGRGS
jgi:hypothetical protein